MNAFARSIWPFFGAVSLLLLCTPSGHCGWALDSTGYHIVGTCVPPPAGLPSAFDLYQPTGDILRAGTGGATYALDVTIGANLVWSSSDGRKAPRRAWVCEEGAGSWSYLFANPSGINSPGGSADGTITYDIPGTTTDVTPQYQGQVLLSDGADYYGSRWIAITRKNRGVSAHATVNAQHNDKAIGALSGSVGYTVAGLRGPVRHPRPSLWQVTHGPYYPATPQPNYSMGGTMHGRDPINLATGQHAYLPAPDIVVYNPSGPAAVYHRNWWSERTMDGGYSSPGLAPGWVDNYDVSITKMNNVLTLVYPNGAEDAINPTSHAGPAGSPYYVDGVGSGTTWSSITLTFNDGTKWTFESQAGSEDLLLSRITNRMGRYISISRESASDDIGESWYRITKVSDDQNKPLLTFSYEGSNVGHLTRVTDRYGRSVGYFITDSEIVSVGHIGGLGQDVATPHWRYSYYDYNYVGTEGPTAMCLPHLKTVQFTNPSTAPTGSVTEQTFVYGRQGYLRSSGSSLPYDEMYAMVTSIIDGNKNEIHFNYQFNGSPNTTQVQVYRRQDAYTLSLEKEWTVQFDSSGRITSETDTAGTTTITYGSSAHPTSITDRNNKTTQFTYDQYGKLTSVMNPKGTTTTLTYDYSTFKPGRLTSIKQGDKSKTSFTYYEPSGLVKSASYPLPGTTGSTSVATISYTYDELGNLLTKKGPGPNGNDVTVRFNYTNDGLVSQPAKLGLPLSISDDLGNTTHFRYDARGNVTTVIDPLGRQTDAMYNANDQVTRLILPAKMP